MERNTWRTVSAVVLFDNFGEAEGWMKKQTFPSFPNLLSYTVSLTTCYIHRVTKEGIKLYTGITKYFSGN